MATLDNYNNVKTKSDSLAVSYCEYVSFTNFEVK